MDEEESFVVFRDTHEKDYKDTGDKRSAQTENIDTWTPPEVLDGNCDAEERETESDEECSVSDVGAVPPYFKSSWRDRPESVRSALEISENQMSDDSDLENALLSFSVHSFEQQNLDDSCYPRTRSLSGWERPTHYIDKQQIKSETKIKKKKPQSQPKRLSLRNQAISPSKDFDTFNNIWKSSVCMLTYQYVENNGAYRRAKLGPLLMESPVLGASFSREYLDPVTPTSFKDPVSLDATCSGSVLDRDQVMQQSMLSLRNLAKLQMSHRPASHTPSSTMGSTDKHTEEVETPLPPHRQTSSFERKSISLTNRNRLGEMLFKKQRIIDQLQKCYRQDPALMMTPQRSAYLKRGPLAPWHQQQHVIHSNQATDSVTLAKKSVSSRSPAPKTLQLYGGNEQDLNRGVRGKHFTVTSGRTESPGGISSLPELVSGQSMRVRVVRHRHL